MVSCSDALNLPSNPIDLEQREGRVHRYKGYAVRKNIAEFHNFHTLKPVYHAGQDPWKILFDKAYLEKCTSKNDMIPFWIQRKEQPRFNAMFHGCHIVKKKKADPIKIRFEPL
jgi:hypothetical protein